MTEEKKIEELPKVIYFINRKTKDVGCSPCEDKLEVTFPVAKGFKSQKHIDYYLDQKEWLSELKKL